MVAMFAENQPVLPYCAVSALSLSFAIFGEKQNLRAITDTLRTAALSPEPYGVQAEYNAEIDSTVVKKVYNRVDGFYSILMHPDIAESSYRIAAPILLIGSLVLAVFAAIAGGNTDNLPHILSALFAGAAPLSLLIAFSVPFQTVAKNIRKSGAAIAGWGAVDEICYTDGACVTDEDIFPPGTLSFAGEGIVYGGVPPEKAMRYTASLIIASGSGLAGIFSELLSTKRYGAIRVDNFTCHENGIGALIRGEQVTTGSAAFMNLLGVRIPDESNMKNAVYTAINGNLAAMFPIGYNPIKSVQNALISVLKWRIKLYFAMRDFNITPLMLETKFKIPLDYIEYTQARESYSISDMNSGRDGRMAIVLSREGFGSFSEALAGCRLLRIAAIAATIMSLTSAALGVLIVFYMCWVGAFMAARPGNLILFMLSMLASVLIVGSYVRIRK
jgi:hypothetical protein